MQPEERKARIDLFEEQGHGTEISALYLIADQLEHLISMLKRFEK